MNLAQHTIFFREKGDTTTANITRYNPLNEAVSLRDAMDRLFADSFISPCVSGLVSNHGAGANLFETANGFIFQVPMPGVKAEDVEVVAQQDTLSLKWTTNLQEPEGVTALWHCFQSGQYQQSFSLPSPINSEGVEAPYSDGILTLNLHKAEHAKTHVVKVNAAK